MNNSMTTERVCAVCKATVAAFPEAMVCHCREAPWEFRPQPIVTTDGLAEELLWDAKNVEFTRKTPKCANYLSGREHGTMRKAADAIQSLTERQASLERALTEARGYIDGLGVLLKAITDHDSIMAQTAIECIDAALSPTNRLNKVAEIDEVLGLYGDDERVNSDD